MERLSISLHIIPAFFTLKVLIVYHRSADVEDSKENIFFFKEVNVWISVRSGGEKLPVKYLKD